MDYGNLIRRSWQITWRHRFLWGLGLFAATTVGSCSPTGGWSGGTGWRTGPEEMGPLPPDLEGTLRSADLWPSPSLETVLALAAVAFLLGLGFAVVSLVAQGGMARATADLALGRPVSAGQAWRAGLRVFWRYLALWLLLIGLALLVALVVGALVALALVLFGQAGEPARILLLLLGGLLGTVLALAAIPVLIGAGVVIAFAQRALAVEEAGPLAGLGEGFRLLRHHLGTSVLAWLISLALSIAAGVAVALSVVALAVPLGVVAVVLYTITGLSAALVFYLIAALLAVVATAWLLGGIANTFFWSYWTLVYLSLTGRLADRTEPPAA